jgi:3-oxoacyl-[acyl-carrier protein] reductase
VRKVVVTGASRGIGLGIAKTLAQSGFQVVAIARNPSDDLLAATSKLPISFMSWDLSQIDTLRALAAQICKTGPVYGLVNNAGIGTASILATMPDADIAAVMQMNVISPITLTKYLVKSMMVGNQGGRIVNISSIVASTGYSGLSVYSASKAAATGFVHALAREVGSLGITVNAVAPGFVATEMTHGMTEKHFAQIKRRSALHKMADVKDIAAAVDFLMCDRAAAITGTVMTIDAGNTA